MSLVLFASLPPALVDSFDRVTAEEATKRFSKCGLGLATTRFDPETRDKVLVANGAKSATDEQLACADKAVSYFDLELPPNVQPRYDALRSARLLLRMKAESRAWLSARGLLNQVPRYKKGVTDDAVFTRQVETLCGSKAKGAFQSGYGFHAMSPDWAQRVGFDEEVFGCLWNVMTVADFEFGFIGNEAFAPAK